MAIIISFIIKKMVKVGLDSMFRDKTIIILQTDVFIVKEFLLKILVRRLKK